MFLSNPYVLLCAALLPALILCVYVFKKDRVEKEPKRLLIKLFLFGAISCFPAAVIENFLIHRVEVAFLHLLPYDNYYLIYLLKYLYNAVVYFICVALVEELCKFGFLYFGTKNNKEFNCFFDGMIYSVFVSLGFAALENIGYVMNYGFGNAVMRGIISVPAHMFFGVLMGYYYSLWHIVEKAREYELRLRLEGVVTSDKHLLSYRKIRLLCVLVPTVAHGIFDFTCTIGESWATFVFYAFVIFLYKYCFGKIKHISKYDATVEGYAKAFLARRYPKAKDTIISYK